MEEVDEGCPMIRMGVSGRVSSGTGLHWVVPDHLPLNVCVCVCVCVFECV